MPSLFSDFYPEDPDAWEIFPGGGKSLDKDSCRLSSRTNRLVLIVKDEQIHCGTTQQLRIRCLALPVDVRDLATKKQAPGFFILLNASLGRIIAAVPHDLNGLWVIAMHTHRAGQDSCRLSSPIDSDSLSSRTNRIVKDEQIHCDRMSRVLGIDADGDWSSDSPKKNVFGRLWYSSKSRSIAHAKEQPATHPAP